MAATGGGSKRQAGKAGAKASRSAAAAKRGEETAAAAKAAGAKGGRLPAVKKALRDSMIVARRQQGLPWEVIADEAGVTVRQCQRACAEHGGFESPVMEDPKKLVDDLLIGYRMSIGDYEAMAYAWFDVNQAAAVGAKKAADDMRQRLFEALGSLGVLPSDLRHVLNEDQQRQILRDVGATIRALADERITAQQAMEELTKLGLFGPPPEVGVEPEPVS